MSEMKQLQQIMEQNQARMKALRESFRSQMSALANEIASALQTLSKIEREFQDSDIRIQEYRERISHNQDQLTELREAGRAIEAKIANTYSDLSEQQQQISSLNAALMETKGKLETLETQRTQRQAQRDGKQTQLDELQQELGRREAEKKEELASFEATLTKAHEQTTRIQASNPVADYLLTEGIEPPELDILAILIHQKEVPVSEIKRFAKTPPAITTRVLKEMEAKGILELTSSDMARLKVML
ncbi:MAG: MarR family transcriptional regulator [Candidatus Hodarchaeota archaeon]